MTERVDPEAFRFEFTQAHRMPASPEQIAEIEQQITEDILRPLIEEKINDD